MRRFTWLKPGVNDIRLHQKKLDILRCPIAFRVQAAPAMSC